MQYTMIQFFHWNYPKDKPLWKEVAAEAENLAQLGFGAVWLPPAFKPSDKGSVGYDVYDLYDLGEFDQKGSVETKYGSKDDYLKAIHSLHEKGVQVYADVILNHKAGADETEEVKAFKVDPEDRTKKIGKTHKIKAYTRFTFPGRGNKYSDFKWNYQCFSGVDWDENRKEEGIFKLINRYGIKWEKMLSKEKGNFDYLMFSDIEFRNKRVRKELLKWGLWYLETTGVDGFRLDAVKHIRISFFKNWLSKLRQKTGKEIFSVGEFASPLDTLLTYIKNTGGCMSLFDFPLHKKLSKAAHEGKDFDLPTLLDDTLVAKKPDSSVTFLDNHDTQPLRENESFVEAWFRPLAYALILLRKEGYPCVFYPDIYGAKYKGKNKEGEEVEIEISPCFGIKEMLKVRKDKAYGMQRDFFSNPHLIGWTREGTEDDDRSGCAVLINNFEEGELEMEIGARHAGQVFYEATGSREDTVKIEDSGKAVFKVNAGSAAVWVAKDD